MTTAAAALSLHPVAAAALGEVAGGVLEALDAAPDLAVVVAGGAHAASLGSITEAVRGVLGPACLLSLGAVGALGPGAAALTTPSVALWAASGIDAVPVPTGVLTGDDAVSALPAAGTLVVVSSGGVALPRLVEALAVGRPGLAVVGGLVDPGGQASGRVGLNGATDEPIAGFVIPPGGATPFGAPAIRPLGDPLVVTDADGPVVAALAGEPAADRFDEVVAELDADRRRLLRHGVFLCRVVNERVLDAGPGDVVAHGVRGLVAGTRSLAVDAAIGVGTLVRFGCLDPDTGADELRRSLADAAGDGAGAATGALLFSCVARGSGFFADVAHDAKVAAEVLGTDAVAGAFCAGEISPRGGRSWLSGYTASGVVVHAGAA